MKTNNLTQASLIAALYVALTLISNIFGLASGVIQFRLSEILTILPMLTPAAIPGLIIGCLLANTLTGAALWDIVFGTLATAIGAVGTRYLGKISPYLGVIPPIVANMLIVPKVLQLVYGAEGSYFYFMLTVGIGEIVMCGIGGIILYKLIGDKI